MTIRDSYTKTVADGDQLNDGYFNGVTDRVLKAAYLDSTGGTIDNSVTETELSDITITANSYYQYIVIMVQCRFRSQNTTLGTKNGTFKLYTGTSATATSNTERASLPLSLESPAGGADAVTAIIGGTLVYVITTSDETFTSDFHVQVTGTNSVAESGTSCIVDNVVVFGA